MIPMYSQRAIIFRPNSMPVGEQIDLSKNIGYCISTGKKAFIYIYIYLSWKGDSPIPLSPLKMYVFFFFFFFFANVCALSGSGVYRRPVLHRKSLDHQ